MSTNRVCLKPAILSRTRGYGMVLLLTFVLILVGGCFFPGREARETRKLKAELPEEVWAAIASDFQFEPSHTKLTRNMSTDLFESYPDVQWWVFSYPGSVEEAYDSLVMPEDAEFTAEKPDDVSIEEILNLHLHLFEAEIEKERGSAWLEEANSQALAWQDMHQCLGSVTLTLEEGVNEEETNVDPYVTWSFVVVSPIVDLDELNLIEGTYLVIMRFQYVFS